MPSIAAISISMLSCIAFAQSALADSAGARCNKEYSNDKKEIRAQIETLRKTIPKELVGPMVASGNCTVRALKLGITFGTKRDFSNAVAVSNAMDCLNIQLYEIEQRCQCREVGATYDNSVEDAIFAEYNEVRKLEKKLLSAGIRNPVIKSLVQNLSATKDCISQASLKLLNDIHTKLNALDVPG